MGLFAWFFQTVYGNPHITSGSSGSDEINNKGDGGIISYRNPVAGQYLIPPSPFCTG